MTAHDWVERLSLEPLPGEGGWFRRTFTGVKENSSRATFSVIHALFTSSQFSTLHRLDADEVFFYQAGDPFGILKLETDGSIQRIVLGPQVVEGQRLQIAFEKGCWFGGSPLDGTFGYTLIGAAVAPEFQWEGFELGNREELRKRFPEAADEITSLTR